MLKNLLLTVLLVGSGLVVLPTTAQAAPGDTTRVTMQPHGSTAQNHSAV